MNTRLIFAYGPTNSGKTFTIEGGKDESAGILPRSLATLFESLAVNTKQGGEDLNVWVSFMEIYNEKVYDLLDQPPSTKNEPHKQCKLKEHNGRIHVKGLRELQVRSEALQLVRYGVKHRQVAETLMNAVSSRSHCVVNITLVPKEGSDTNPKDIDPFSQVYSKLAIVDLAGSERALRTCATGERLKEASNINASLFNLGRCLEELRWNQMNPNKLAHVVPFRHSNLTRIFQVTTLYAFVCVFLRTRGCVRATILSRVV